MQVNNLRAPLPWQLDDWQRLDATSRSHHAVMLEGRRGTALDILALDYARFRLCEVPTQLRACGVCHGCVLVAQQTHPDLALILPPAQMQERELVFHADWVKTGSKPSQDIIVAQVRWLIEWFSTTANRGREKVAVLYPAETMNHVSANALLKLLEEPPSGACFILATYRSQDLLPTLRSRCSKLVTSLPTDEQVAQWLASQHIEQSAQLAHWSHGQPLQAAENQQSLAWAERWLASFPTHRGAALELIDAQTSSATVFAALERLAADLHRMQWGATPMFLTSKQAQSLLDVKVSVSKLAEFQRRLLDYQRLSQHPVQQRLLCESALLEFATCLT